MLLTRFAPAPTGALHLGHVANAIYVWGLAARRGGKVLLRVEDHDRQRSRWVYEAALLDDLDWLGFVPDSFPTSAFRAGWCESRQSNRGAIYEAAARALEERGLVYGCTCSRQELRTQDLLGGAGNRVVNQHGCRARGIGLVPDVAWRLRIDDAVETFTDLLQGTHSQDAAAGGDPVIRDRRGNWTYQFAVVVDDHDQGVDLVIRGLDLLTSTGLQMWLARLLGRETSATFAHHPLIMKSPAQKLSKSDHDTGIADLRAAGMKPADVIGRAACEVGLTPSPSPIQAADVAFLFDNLG